MGQGLVSGVSIRAPCGLAVGHPSFGALPEESLKLTLLPPPRPLLLFWALGAQTKLAVKAAIAAGYRHIDGAWIYGNEIEVGQGIREAIREGLVTRGELFVTSKLWVHSFDTREVERACRDTLDDLFGPSDSEVCQTLQEPRVPDRSHQSIAKAFRPWN